MEPQAVRDLTWLLDLPDSELWSDFGSTTARAVIDKNPEEWLPWLQCEWLHFSPKMQEHLAYILCGDEPGSAEHQILVQMSRSPHEEVAWRAKEELNDHR